MVEDAAMQSFDPLVDRTQLHPRWVPDTFGGIAHEFRVLGHAGEHRLGATETTDVLGFDESSDQGTVNLHCNAPRKKSLSMV